jgi:hypothetical protein
MRQVATKKPLLQNVDWLTEFFARVSNSEPGKELSPHLMKGALRISRKVCFKCIGDEWLLIRRSGPEIPLVTWIGNGVIARYLLLKMH